MQRPLSILALTLALSLGSACLKAEEAAAAPALKISGFVDAYYKLAFNGVHAASPTFCTFDAHQNMFAVAGGRLGATSALADSGVTGVIDLYLGDYARVLSGNMALAPKLESVYLGQAFITEAFGPVTLTLGHFMTHVGYEVVDAPLNYNYSRSRLFGAIPFDHTGLKAVYAPLEGLSLMAMADNGNGVNVSADESTAGGGQVLYSGVKGLTLVGNYYYEPVLNTVWESKHYLDLLATYNVFDGLAVGAEYLYITLLASSEKDGAGNALGSSVLDVSTGLNVPYAPKSQGYALYVNAALPFVTGLSAAGRFETLFMPDAFQTDFTYTGTLKYAKGSVINYLELRSDVSTQPIFTANPADPGNLQYSELTLTYGAALSF